ncbi:argonaute-like protein [Gymnopilus junonius]|uniref:Argonaute-like protein n=1 Tax=Gymnopilus junonius TaxID=109634 RepID=A0A9P5TU98_GYMJU|nr:argonaute-like protein [Gymnopilus junonius]
MHRLTFVFSNQASVKTVGVKRPGYGQGGRPVNVLVNAFAVEVTDEMIYHYDAITPDNLPSRLNMQLYGRLQEQVPAFRGVVYDGRKNLFTVNKLPLGQTDGASFDVVLQPQGPPGARPPKVYKVKVTKVAEINTELLHRFIAGKQSQDNAVQTSIMALNIVIRMQPNQKYPFNVRSFFTPANKKAIGAGIELWRGYFQSLRPAQNKLYVNLDISTGMMYKDGPLLALCLEFLGRPGQDENLLSPRRGFPDRERVRLQRFLVGMRVITEHSQGGGKRERGYVVKRLTAEGANTRSFTDREGKSMTVANYFDKVVGRRLKFPDIICIEVGSGAVIPLELCRVPPGQIMRKQIPSDKTNDMLEFSKLDPPQRLASIRQGLQVLQYGQSEYIRQFGMKISETPMSVRARVLPPPMLKYGEGSAQKTIKPANGSWNMRDKKFFKPSVIKQWVIVVYESERRFPRRAAEEMAFGFCQGAVSVGMQVMDSHPVIVYENGQGVIGEQLKRAGKACLDQKKSPPNLMVVVLPEGGNQIYTAVKHFGDVTMGVATQCLKSNKCSRAKPQYWANVMLKLNVKLGGINSVLGEMNAALNDPGHPTIVMGADVNHPAPGADGRPSFAALVSSVDSTTAKYISESRVQMGRVEMIEDLENMCKAAIGKYAGYQNAFEKGRPPPSRLIFYRDGVSEGQFQQVLDDELPKIKKACQAMKINPKITLVVVGKRHHIRMFPQNPGDADKTGNCQAGTTIDEGLGHPTEFDYYQLTHGGLLGTSRPAHYSVIYDENKFSADAMQSLSFALCHVYARATRSVSIPAPVYYADIVCARAKNHYTPGTDLDLSETATQVSHAEGQLQAFRAGYKPLHANMANLMYFM